MKLIFDKIKNSKRRFSTNIRYEYWKYQLTKEFPTFSDIDKKDTSFFFGIHVKGKICMLNSIQTTASLT